METSSANAQVLLRPLTDGETLLLSTVHEEFTAEGLFPLFDFVERTLYHTGVDATYVLAHLPTIGVHALYGLVWPAGPQYWQADQTIELTVAGLTRSPRGEGDVAIFIAALAALSERERRIRPLPFEVPRTEVSSAELARDLVSAGFDSIDLAMKKIRTLLRYEPRDAVSGVGGTDEEWTVTLSKDLRRYRDVKDASDFLDRVAESVVAMSTAGRTPRYASPLQLSESIDYLDQVWLTRFRARLFHLKSATVIVQLSLECATEDEFRSRLSGICDVLAGIDVPSSTDAGSLLRLLEFLKAQAGVVDMSRVGGAIESLRAITDIRAGFQHTDARQRTVNGFARLGIPYPPPGWGGAWEMIAAAAVEALNAIREEIQRESPG
jgi:hypothetical protein